MSLDIVVEDFENSLATQLAPHLALVQSQHEALELERLHSLAKRSSDHEFPVMQMKRGKKKRTCQNMDGVLGGSNAFNFLSFVAGVITLVVNVNNNVNNNNNNLNGINANVNSQENNNANANSNAANIILAMPGRRKKRSLTTSPLVFYEMMREYEQQRYRLNLMYI